MWYAYPKKNPNLTLAEDPTAPQSPPSVFSTRFREGTLGGRGPVNWGGWDAAAFPEGQKQKIYLSMWIKIVGEDYENHPTGTKMGFIAVGRDPKRGENETFFSIKGNGTQSPQRSLPLVLVEQAPIRPGMTIQTRQEMTTNAWHHWEAIFELNELGRRNGKFRWWQDGELVLSRDDMVYIIPGNEVGFNHFKWNPTWGGKSGPVKRRDDFMFIDHLYLSGVPIR
jgi:hypothetical protein